MVSLAILTIFIIRVLFERYLVRKISLIYKAIYSSKRANVSDDLTLNSSFEDLDSEVAAWANTRNEEILILKNLEQYRKNYLGNISHELKTPIFTVQGFIHTLIEGGLYDDKVNMKYLKRASNNIDRLKDIVDDLELINKLESGKDELELTKFDIVKLINDVKIDLSFQGKKSKTDINIVLQESNAYIVVADREKIRQVLNNLIVNAIKYGKDKGQITISAEDMGSQVLIEVSDDGIGIGEEHQKHLFDRFYRVDHGRSRKEGGSGLGLSIVKHIIDAHEQNINIRSTVGEGSTFGFTLSKA
jgi:two-component system phosphate regulon sensor histidine kinase PhoR